MERPSGTIFITAIALLIGIGAANAQFSLSGELRPRTEYRHGYKALAEEGQENALFTNQRTRLNFHYKGEGSDFHVTLQDVRTWGSQPQLTSSDGARTTIHEAWGRAKLGDHFGLKFGRQEIIYDDHRIFGNVGWAQQARSHDAALLQFRDSMIHADVGVAYNQDGPKLESTFYSVPNSYKALQYLWLHLTFTPELEGSLLLLNNGKQANEPDSLNGQERHWKDRYSQTVGGRATYQKKAFAAHGNAYYQTGLAGRWEETEIDAWLFGLDIAYTVTERYHIKAGFERQSGNDLTDTSKDAATTQNAFTPLYGTNHKFNGFMDYFYVGNHLGSVGLQDNFLKVKYSGDKVTFGIHGHHFSTAADIPDPETLANSGEYEAMDRYLGTEIDLFGGFELAPGVNFKAGYSQMFATETMEALKGGNAEERNNWGWVMISMRPTLIE